MSNPLGPLLHLSSEAPLVSLISFRKERKGASFIHKDCMQKPTSFSTPGLLLVASGKSWPHQCPFLHLEIEWRLYVALENLSFCSQQDTSSTAGAVGSSRKRSQSTPPPTLLHILHIGLPCQAMEVQGQVRHTCTGSEITGNESGYRLCHFPAV